MREMEKSPESMHYYLDLIDEAVLRVGDDDIISYENFVARKHFGDLIGTKFTERFTTKSIFADDQGRIWTVTSHKDLSFEGAAPGTVKIIKRNLTLNMDALQPFKDSDSPFEEDEIKQLPEITSFYVSPSDFGKESPEAISRNFYDKILDTSDFGVAIYKTDRDGGQITPLTKNLAFEVMRLARLPVITGRSLTSPMSEADETYIKALKRVAKSGKAEKIILTVKDRQLWEEVKVLPLCEDKVASVHRDVTREKLDRVDLETKTALLNVVDRAIITTDLKRRITFWNKSAESLFGWTFEEVAGKSILNFAVPDELLGDTQSILNSLRDGIKNKVTLRIRKKDGLFVSAQASIDLIQGATDRLRAIVYILSMPSDPKKSQSYLSKSIDGLIETLSTIVEVKDPFTAGHQRRVSKLAVAIAREMRLSSEQIDTIRSGALLHDIGKVAVPVEILCKPGRLTDQEWYLIQDHSEAGYRMLEKIELPGAVSNIVRQHHERLDGSGYPLGLHGEEILLESKVVAVADVFEAIVSHRPYRPAHQCEKAIAELVDGAGNLYDSGVVATCLSLIEGGFELD